MLFRKGGLSVANTFVAITRANCVFVDFINDDLNGRSYGHRPVGAALGKSTFMKCTAGSSQKLKEQA